MISRLSIKLLKKNKTQYECKNREVDQLDRIEHGMKIIHIWIFKFLKRCRSNSLEKELSFQ